MEVRSLLRPLGLLASSSATTTTTNTAAAAAAAAAAATCCRRHYLTRVVVVVARRQQSTTSRTKKALKIAPHPSFLAAGPASPTANHVIFNPPSSAPSVYHTPFKFLPKSDPRRQANLSQFLLQQYKEKREHERQRVKLHQQSISSTSSTSTSTSTSTSSSDGGVGGEGEGAGAGAGAGDLPPTLTADEEVRTQPQRNVTREQVDEMRALRAEDPERWSVVRLARRFGCTNWFVMICCRAPAEHAESERVRKQAVRARWGPIRTHARDERGKRKALLLRGEL